MHYPSLDGLRGIAVIIVLLAHAHVPGFRSGGVGVDIFFVLSGFLITSILLREQDRHGSISIKNFYARRFLRLTPCLWMVIFCFLLYTSCLDGPSQVHALKESGFSIVYVMNWAKAYGYHEEGSLGHTWSLAIEEQYYLLWPLLVIALSWLGLRRCQFGWLVVAAAVSVALYRACAVGTYSASRIYFGLDTHADGLLAGSALACFVSNFHEHRLSATWGKLISYLLSPCAVLFGLVGVMACWTWADPEMGLYGYAIVAASSSVVVLDLVASSHSILRLPLTFGPLVWTGKISYGLYLWHFPIYEAVHQHLGFGYKKALLVGGTLTILVAAASYYFVERRFLLLKDRFTRSPDPAEHLPANGAADVIMNSEDSIAAGREYDAVASNWR